MKPVDEMSDEEVIEELSNYRSSVVIDITGIKKARELLKILRAAFSIEGDENEDI